MGEYTRYIYICSSLVGQHSVSLEDIILKHRSHIMVVWLLVVTICTSGNNI